MYLFKSMKISVLLPFLYLAAADLEAATAREQYHPGTYDSQKPVDYNNFYAQAQNPDNTGIVPTEGGVMYNGKFYPQGQGSLFGSSWGQGSTPVAPQNYVPQPSVPQPYMPPSGFSVIRGIPNPYANYPYNYNYYPYNLYYNSGLSPSQGPGMSDDHNDLYNSYPGQQRGN